MPFALPFATAAVTVLSLTLNVSLPVAVSSRIASIITSSPKLESLMFNEMAEVMFLSENTVEHVNEVKFSFPSYVTVTLWIPISKLLMFKIRIEESILII